MGGVGVKRITADTINHASEGACATDGEGGHHPIIKWELNGLLSFRLIPIHSHTLTHSIVCDVTVYAPGG